MKNVQGWRKIEIVSVVIVVAFMSLLIGIYYQSKTERETSGHSAVGGIR